LLKQHKILLNLKRLSSWSSAFWSAVAIVGVERISRLSADSINPQSAKLLVHCSSDVMVASLLSTIRQGPNDVHEASLHSMAHIYNNCRCINKLNGNKQNRHGWILWEGGGIRGVLKYQISGYNTVNTLFLYIAVKLMLKLIILCIMINE